MAARRRVPLPRRVTQNPPNKPSSKNVRSIVKNRGVTGFHTNKDASNRYAGRIDRPHEPDTAGELVFTGIA